MTAPNPIGHDPDMSWSRWAACRNINPRLFYPERGEISRQAKLVCLSCPVRNACREHGIRYERFGIWGGLSERERQKLRAMAGIDEELCDTQPS